METRRAFVMSGGDGGLQRAGKEGSRLFMRCSAEKAGGGTGLMGQVDQPSPRRASARVEAGP